MLSPGYPQKQAPSACNAGQGITIIFLAAIPINAVKHLSGFIIQSEYPHFQSADANTTGSIHADHARASRGCNYSAPVVQIST